MKNYLIITAFLGAITIVLGAFGAHALKDILNEDGLKSFETAVRYQMYHVIVLLFTITYSKFTHQTKKGIALLFLLGILFFSGSIYAITFGINPKYSWFVTPIGGFFFIFGWLKMAFAVYKNQ